ncbi:MAG: hypothetical protein LBU05_00610, partial [Bifidobacteriaceae bacterium]|nr:hypothetical protein [Bifidobacteriaceae bacterium]
AYLADYEPQVTALQPGREAFFPNRQGRPNSSSTIGHWSAQLLNAADDEQTTARPGPRGRPYDLRHAHVVENINRETLAGRGPQALVPHLAAHLGHKNLEDTWHYFHLAPDFHHDLRELANSGVEDTIAEAGHGIL